MDIDFSKPVDVDFDGEGKKDGKWTAFFSVNNIIVTADELRTLIEDNRDAAWNFRIDSLRVFLDEILPPR